MSNFNKIFKVNKPIIGVVHLGPLLLQLGCPGMKQLGKQMMKDLKALVKGGVDGVIIENEADHPHTLKINTAQLAAMTGLVMQAVEYSPVPVGISVLLVDWEASLAIAKATGAGFIRLNVFVDTVMRKPSTWGTVDVASRGVIKINPEKVLAYKHKLKAKEISLLTDVQVKYMKVLEANKSIATSVKEAKQYGSDGVIISGEETGKPVNINDLLEAKKSVKNFPVIIGSGLTDKNVCKMLPFCDGAIVGTYFKSKGKIDINKVKKICLKK